MLSAIAIIPSAPVLVPELAGTAAAETRELRTAMLDAAATLPARWIGLGIAGVDATLGPDCAGTLAGFGVDVPVALTPGITSQTELPLCALMAGWVRGQACPDGSVQVRAYAADRTAADALALGRRLRAEIDREPESFGVLVVADGVNTLTPSAPGGYDPSGADAQLALDNALATGDTDALTRLPDPVRGRVAFQVLAGLAEPGPRSTKELYRGAPYGVGYFAGVWQP
ncbi:hypothetical protein [Mycobacterium vicinigordonae]|uniref:Uncharacterized protein n=1 Tax=Mycobacterium vicinigordonae TaxID=1719132 RepID=A0A7D6E231_9MYCO|nr:hypothetical protein [Mycobacterium vicinigordonae]QLL09349.1 hypothetical protein H0P51_10970 [Mycobacterium vicinigordonae]